MKTTDDIFEEQMQEPDPQYQNFIINQQQFAETRLEIFKLGLTKEDIPQYANALVENVLEHGNPLDIAENIKVMEELLEAVKKDKRFKDFVRDEVAKYGREGYKSPRGVNIEPFEAGGRYDYESCGDPIFNELSKQLKERQEFLKKIPKDGIDVLVEEGELVRIYPPQKTPSTSSYKITLQKSK